MCWRMLSRLRHEIGGKSSEGVGLPRRKWKDNAEKQRMYRKRKKKRESLACVTGGQT